LVAASVVLPANWRRPLQDSKQLSAVNRKQLSDYILTRSLSYGIGWVDNQEIDELGLSKALPLAYLRALEAMKSEFSVVVLDGNVDYLKEYGFSQTLVGADQKVACVAAASIIAKVARDEYMQDLAVNYPGYGFDSNVGYGTRAHTDMISQIGLTELHRKSFCGRYQ